MPWMVTCPKAAVFRHSKFATQQFLWVFSLPQKSQIWEANWEGMLQRTDPALQYKKWCHIFLVLGPQPVVLLEGEFPCRGPFSALSKFSSVSLNDMKTCRPWPDHSESLGIDCLSQREEVLLLGTLAMGTEILAASSPFDQWLLPNTTHFLLLFFSSFLDFLIQEADRDES